MFLFFVCLDASTRNPFIIEFLSRDPQGLNSRDAESSHDGVA